MAVALLQAFIHNVAFGLVMQRVPAAERRRLVEEMLWRGRSNGAAKGTNGESCFASFWSQKEDFSCLLPPLLSPENNITHWRTP
jgi:hypothetical protein